MFRFPELLLHQLRRHLLDEHLPAVRILHHVLVRRLVLLPEIAEDAPPVPDEFEAGLFTAPDETLLEPHLSHIGPDETNADATGIDAYLTKGRANKVRPEGPTDVYADIESFEPDAFERILLSAVGLELPTRTISKADEALLVVAVNVKIPHLHIPRSRQIDYHLIRPACPDESCRPAAGPAQHDSFWQVLSPASLDGCPHLSNVGEFDSFGESVCLSRFAVPPYFDRPGDGQMSWREDHLGRGAAGQSLLDGRADFVIPVFPGHGLHVNDVSASTLSTNALRHLPAARLVRWCLFGIRKVES